MSSYLSFYLRKKDTDIYTPLYTVSRSHALYEVFADEFGNYLDEFDRCRALTPEQLNTLYHAAKEKVARYKNDIDNTIRNKREVGQWNNSVEEKIDLMRSLDEQINYLEEQHTPATAAMYFISFLIGIEEEQYASTHPTLYAGVDGRNPSAVAKKLSMWESDEE